MRESAADDAYIRFGTQATGGGITERLRITSGGDINIHNTTAVSTTDPITVDLGGQFTANASITQANLKLKLYHNGANGDATGITASATGLSYVSSHTTDHIFYTVPSSINSLVERLRISSDGTTTFKNATGGTLKVGGASAHTSKIVIADNGGTANGNCLVEGGDGSDFFTIQSNGNVAFENGKGINFGATEGSGATTSVLDDYEEGVFTPTLSGGTSASDMYYTKIGRVVHISGSLAFDSISGSGNMVIGGLPYTSINGLDAYTNLSSHAYDSLNVGNQTYQFQTIRVDKGTTNMRIIIPAGNGNVRTFAQYSHVSSSTFRFRVAGFYITA